MRREEIGPFSITSEMRQQANKFMDKYGLENIAEFINMSISALFTLENHPQVNLNINTQDEDEITANIVVNTDYKENLSYHDLYITTDQISRSPLSSLPLSLHLRFNRTTGWELWIKTKDSYHVLAGEFNDKGLRLDIGGFIICDSLKAKNNDHTS